MKRFFDKFLWGVLWLLSVTLATTFWMNMNYGFDMLSAPHWEYLATLQAHRYEVKPDFYISLIIALFIALVGLYLIVRPRQRNIQTPQTTTNVVPQPSTQPTQSKAPPQPTVQENKAHDFTPRPAPTISLGTRPLSPSGLRLPTRQSMPTPQPQPTANIPQPPIIPNPQPVKPQNTNPPEVQATLESANYIIKKCDRIGKLENPTVAVAYNQTVWIVATKTAPGDVLNALQTLVTIFDDTLGETSNDIKLHGLVINPTEPIQRSDDLIITFENISEFITYVNEHKNTKPDDYDAELFEAFSTYISTVTGYIGKI